jgi:hypothetical protein
MNFGLIIVGDEILSGKRQDKHLAKVIELLGARGLSAGLGALCGRRPGAHHRGAAHAFASGDLVFSCGGIGATPDDHTRQCAPRRWAAAGAAPRGARADPGAHARRRRRAGLPYEPDRPTTCTGSTWACFRRAPHHPQPLQQDPRLQRSATCTSCPASR